MQTSFALWLEARDPELFLVLEAEWTRRDRSPLKRGLLGAAAMGAALAGWGWWNSGEDQKAPTAPDTKAQVVHVAKAEKPAEESGRPKKYMGGDREDIFRYACEQSHNGINIFPYYVNGKQEGLIARVSLAKTPTSPLSAKTLNTRYDSFVSQIRATMKGRNVLKIDGEVAGQGPVNWELITWSDDDLDNLALSNPNRSESGMVEIVLFAPKKAGVK